MSEIFERFRNTLYQADRTSLPGNFFKVGKVYRKRFSVSYVGYADNVFIVFRRNANAVKVNACRKNFAVVMVCVVAAYLGSSGCAEKADLCVSERFFILSEQIYVTFFLCGNVFFAVKFCEQRLKLGTSERRLRLTDIHFGNSFILPCFYTF